MEANTLDNIEIFTGNGEFDDISDILNSIDEDIFDEDNEVNNDVEGSPELDESGIEDLIDLEDIEEDDIIAEDTEHNEIDDIDIDEILEDDILAENTENEGIDKILEDDVIGDLVDADDNSIEEVKGIGEDTEGNESADIENSNTSNENVKAQASREKSDFITDKGIVVMEEDNGDNFKIKYIDIEKIAIVKRIRRNTTNVEDLVTSIKSTGLLEPLVVAPTETEGVYVLLAGFRRIMACAKIGKRSIPCVINTKASVPEIPVLEALYNHSKKYTMREIVDYIDYLEKQKGIMSASMIEYLLQLNSGDYTKLKDILNDNDEDIVDRLMNGEYTIDTAFKKLEKRRKKESADEKDNKKAERVYEDTSKSGADNIEGSGDNTEDDTPLSEDEIKSLSFNASELAEEDEKDLDEMVEDSKKMEGFEPNKQDYKNREILDPALRKAVLARDKNTCQCCGLSGQEYSDVFDIHHIVEVYLGGSDNIDNLITTCICCHRLIHSYARGDLYIRPASELAEEEQKKFKKIIKLGNVIREGMAKKHMKKEELKKLDKAETIGRTKPGTPKQVAT